VVYLEDAGEGRLSNLANGDVVLPLDERLPLLLSLQLTEEVLRADE